jgi:hypothetical protein
MIKECIACGMTMETPQDFAMGDETRDYCRFCAREDGSMQSYEEKLQSLTQFVINTQGFNDAVARKMVKEMMKKLPAWKDHT